MSESTGANGRFYMSSETSRQLREAMMSASPLQAIKEEWNGEGVPPVGTECECFHRISTGKTNWVKCDVIGPYGDYVICAPNGGGFYGFDLNELRSIHPQAQRERDEIIIDALRHVDDPRDDEVHPWQYFMDALHTLYDAGMLRRAGE